MMATTELHKIPDTILSRSQVFEFRTIPTSLIAGQLRKIVDVEKIQASDAALALIARAAEGSMRDAQSALDQVIAFAGNTIAVEDVSTVLGLVGRDLLFDLIEAVVAEDAPAAFALADRAVEGGHDLRLVLRELARAVRDLMIVAIDPSRASEGEFAEGERERLVQLSARFSREDLMRAFDLLSKAEQEIRSASHPRYQFEMVLLKWMHTRKLVPLTELLEGAGGAARVAAPRGAPQQLPTANSQLPRKPVAQAPISVKPVAASSDPGSRVPDPGPRTADSSSASTLKDALLAEIRAKKGLFYNTVVAQAQRIDVSADRVTFSFLPTHRALREQLEATRPWLEAAAEKIAGRKVAVVAMQGDAAATSAPSNVSNPSDPRPPIADPGASPEKKRDLKAEAMSSSTVQAMLDVFPAEIRDVEETQ
jgi:DNA polymerase-3 subunit gamma/tau